MLVVNQWNSAFYSTTGLVEVNLSKLDKKQNYQTAIYMNCINGGNEQHRLLAMYNTEQDAKFAMTQFYNAYKEDERDFRMPAKDEIPDLKIMKSKGRYTNMKLSHGGS